MNIGYLYFLLPVFCFAISGVVQASVSRRIGARKVSLYRQITLLTVGLPIGFTLLNETDLIQENIGYLTASGILGTCYLITAYHAMNLTSIGISRTFVAVSRTITAFIVGFFIFQEAISIFDLIGVGVILLGYYMLSKLNNEKLHKNDLSGIIVSLFAGVIFSLNMYVFKKYAQDFSPLQSAYLLETMNAIFLIFGAIALQSKKKENLFKIQNKELKILFLTAPLIILSSYGLAKSIGLIQFYIFNTLFVFTLIVSIAISWIFLKEKFSLTQLISLGSMILGCSIIILL